MPGFANEEYVKAVGEVFVVDVACDRVLRDGETITGTPTCSVSGLTVGGISVNSVAIDVLGISRGEGTVITTNISGGTSGRRYDLRFVYQTTLSQTLHTRDCIIQVVEN